MAINNTRHGSVSVAGNAQEDATLSAVVSNAAEGTTVSYQWQSSDGLSIDGTTNWTNISGATNATYAVAETDETRFLRVEATFVDSAGTTVSPASDPTSHTVTDASSLSVSVAGIVQEGKTLTATPTIGDPDDQGATVTYQWERDQGDWFPIPGATSSTYTVDETDENFHIRVEASFVDDTGQTVSAVGGPTLSTVIDASSLAVSVSGDAQEGQTLSASWSIGDPDDQGETVPAFQWQRSTNGADWIDIIDATAATHRVGEGDENRFLRVKASFFDDTNQKVTADSTPIFSKLLSVSLSGTAQEGATLSAAPAIVDEDDQGATITYCWQSSANGVDWSNIDGAADSPTYTVAEGDEKQFIRVEASLVDDTGQTVSAVSDPTPSPVIDASSLSVTLGGTAQEGQTLTATPTIADEDDRGATVTYQWQRFVPETGGGSFAAPHISGCAPVGAGWSNIDGATDATYAVAEGDENSRIRVEASFVDDTGQTVNTISDPTQSVVDQSSLSVAITGTTQEGSTLIATPTIVDDDDRGATVSYQWERSEIDGWFAIPDATNSTYTLAEADEGNFIRVEASFVDDTGQTLVINSDQTASTVAGNSTLSVSFTGTAQEGQMLRASPTIGGDGDDREATISYQWQSSTSDVDWSNIDGATHATYTVAEGDENQFLRVEASFRDETGHKVRADSAATESTVIDASSLSVTLDGTAQEGEILTASPMIVGDGDDQGATVTFQWQRLVPNTDAETSGGWSNIDGATQATYTPTEGDENSLIRVVASFVDETGQTVSAVSDQTPSTVIDASSLAVTLGGTPKEGEMLTATPTIADEDDGAATVTYQWQRSNFETEGTISVDGITGVGWSDITDATGSTYTVAEGDENKFIRVKASFVDDTGQTISTISDQTSRVADASSLSVTLGGTAQEGQVLTASPTIDDEDDRGATVTYQWQSLAFESNWTDIAGATTSTYTVAETDERKAIRVKAFFVDDTGQTVSAVSNRTSSTVIDASSLSVTLRGTAQEGQVLTASPTIADEDDRGATVTYQWQHTLFDDSASTSAAANSSGAGWSNIAGATQATYTVAEGDEDRFIRVVATFVDDTRHAVRAISDPTPSAVIDASNLSVTVTGSARVHHMLSASPAIGDADDGEASVSYQWQRFTDGSWTDIDNAKSSTYTVAPEDAEKLLRVEASFTDDTGQTVTADSDPIAGVNDVTLMMADTFTATESTTGDTITGVVFDNTGKYTVGSSVTTTGADNLDGSWTYRVTGVALADTRHQDTAYAGFVYDTTYVDQDIGATVSTFYGATGLNTGVNDLTANYSGKDGLGSDGDLVTINRRMFAIASGRYVVPEGEAVAPFMTADSFTAVESKTGDIINGVLFDGSGNYTVGSSVTTGPDNLGGSWTYRVTGIANADARHQDPAYSGFVYDTSYVDQDIGTTVSTFYGAAGLNTGVNDLTANYSGKGGLGSDGDVVTINRRTFAIASGRYVVPEGEAVAPVMTADSFTAVESKTGDIIAGVLFDNSGKYNVGSAVTTGPDNLGGNWIYTVTGVTTADTRHQNAAYSGFVYDTSYVDHDLGTTVSTFYGATGLNTGLNDLTANYSGNQGLGSDGDVVTINRKTFAIASGRYVVPEGQAVAPVMTADSFRAVESKTGDTITGVLFDDSGKYNVGSAITTGPDNLGGTWTYTVTGVTTADTRHQSAAYSGFVYDTSYADQDLGVTVATSFGATGLTTGVNDLTANFSGNQGLGSDGDVVTINRRTFAIGSGRYVVPEGQAVAPIMTADSFTAMESKTGDIITGVLFDNTSKYSVGSAITTGPDNLGGNWTYTVTSISTADTRHQNAAYSGFVYDTSYVDHDLGITVATSLGAAGLNTGVNDLTGNFSGNQGLGSDADTVTLNGRSFAIAGSGHSVVPEQPVVPTMTADSFTAVESKTGDTLTGVVFDNTGRYSVGSSVTPGPDNVGGSWTYTVTGITAADAAHQNAAFTGLVYDTAYFDRDLGISADTVFGKIGLASANPQAFFSGNQYLGSDRDFVRVGSSLASVGGNSALPDTQANLALLSNLTAASFVSPSGAGTTANVPPQDPSTMLTSPVPM